MDEKIRNNSEEKILPLLIIFIEFYLSPILFKLPFIAVHLGHSINESEYQRAFGNRNKWISSLCSLEVTPHFALERLSVLADLMEKEVENLISFWETFCRQYFLRFYLYQ